MSCKLCSDTHDTSYCPLRHVQDNYRAAAEILDGKYVTHPLRPFLTGIIHGLLAVADAVRELKPSLSGGGAQE